MKNNSIVRTGSSEDARVSSVLQKGKTITVIGKCGVYYCLGRNQFVLKKDVDILPSDFTIKYNRISMYNNQTVKLNETIQPEIANKTIKWESKKPEVASISNGEIRAIKGGTTTITGTTINAKKVQCTVKVCTPVTKVTLSPDVFAVEKEKTGKLAVSYNPVSQVYNTIKWESFNSKIAAVSNGIVIGKAENTTTVKVTATPLKPTVGMQRSVQRDTIFISVYTKGKKKLYVSPHGADIPQYIAASDKMKYIKKNRIRKHELLSVIGSCGKFYYVEYVKDKTNRVFIHKDKVQEVELLHKELKINQRYIPYEAGKKNSKIIRNETLTDKKRKQKTVYKTNIAFLKGKGFVKKGKEELTAKGRGSCFICIQQTIKKYKKNKLQTKQTKIFYYQLHITIPKNVGALTGYTKKKTQVYQCAGMDCPMEALSENTRVTIIGKVKEKGKVYLQIKYKKVGSKGAKEEYKGYACESDFEYIYISPIVMSNKLVNRKIKSISKKIEWHTAVKDKKIAKISIDKEIVKTHRKQLSHITISGVKSGNEMKHGYVTVTAETGRFIANVPVTVYKPMKHYQGYVKKVVELKSGGSDSKYCPVVGLLPRNSKLTIIGQVGKYFYVETEDPNIGKGTRGFVLKDHIVYIDVSREYVSINKKERAEAVRITYFNAINMDIRGINKSVEFYPKREPELIKKYEKNQKKGKVSQIMRTYYIHPKREGMAKIRLTNGPLRFTIFVSAYTAINNIEAFINKDNTPCFKGTYKDQPGARLNAVGKNTGCRIIGKIGNRWSYVKNGRKKFWMDEDRLTYISLKWYSKDMYQYHSVENYAYLNNSRDDNKQKLNVSDKKKVKETLSNGDNAKKLKIFADKPTEKNKPVVLSFSYDYGKGIITRKATLTIKDIHIKISPKNKRLVIVRTTTKTGTEKKITDKYPKADIAASIFTLRDKAVSWDLVPDGKAKIIKKSKNSITVEVRKKGKIKVTARYRGIKKDSCLDVSLFNNTVIKHDFNIENKNYLLVLKELMDHAMELCDNNVEEANDLIFQYMRDGKYYESIWRSAAGKIDTKKVEELRKRLNKMRYFEKNKYADGFGNKLDMRHLCASIHVITYETSSFENLISRLDEDEIDLAATTVGDMASGIGNYYAYAQVNKTTFSFDHLRKLYQENKEVFPNLSPTDLLEDMDAYLIAQKLKANSKLTFYDAFIDYYSKSVRQAKKDYLSQYTDKEWKQMVSSTLKNSNLKNLIETGAKKVLENNGQKMDKSNYKNKITNIFLEDVASGFKEFIKEFYGGFRK